LVRRKGGKKPQPQGWGRESKRKKTETPQLWFCFKKKADQGEGIRKKEGAMGWPKGKNRCKKKINNFPVKKDNEGKGAAKEGTPLRPWKIGGGRG